MYRPTNESTFEQKLYSLIEECGEVVQAAGKLLRFGPDSGDPRVPIESRLSNAHQLSRELVDLRDATNLMASALINMMDANRSAQLTKCSVFVPVKDEKPPVKTILLLRDQSGDIYWGDVVYGNGSDVPVFRIFSESGETTFLADEMNLVITHWLPKKYDVARTREFLTNHD